MAPPAPRRPSKGSARKSTPHRKPSKPGASGKSGKSGKVHKSTKPGRVNKSTKPGRVNKSTKPGKPAAGTGRGRPKISTRARRVAHGFVAASDAPDAGVASPRVDEKGMRLNRWLAEQGVDSRRKCDARIQSGEVEVNGRLCVEPGYRVQPGDDVMVNGARVKETRRLYYLFHKPRGVLCTNDPRETRTRVCDLVDPMVPGRVFLVGRLDEDSEGLLLLTNDGEFANLVAHPRHGVPKTYVCQVSGTVDGDTLEGVRGGAWIDGSRVLPEKVRIARRTPAGTSLEITIREGRNREVRRMLARHGLGVKRLKRVRIGALGMQGLKRGTLRPLSRHERDALVALARGPKGEDAVQEEAGARAPRRRGKR